MSIMPNAFHIVFRGENALNVEQIISMMVCYGKELPEGERKFVPATLNRSLLRLASEINAVGEATTASFDEDWVEILNLLASHQPGARGYGKRASNHNRKFYKLMERWLVPTTPPEVQGAWESMDKKKKVQAIRNHCPSPLGELAYLAYEYEEEDEPEFIITALKNIAFFLIPPYKVWKEVLIALKESLQEILEPQYSGLYMDVVKAASMYQMENQLKY